VGEPTWDKKVLLLDSGLRKRGLSYAFGGAIALNYHREPRSTLDIDINIFVQPRESEAVVGLLEELFELDDRARLERELAHDGQTRASWGYTFIDLFLANTDFHRSMAERVERKPFANRLIPVLSIEDLLVCKVLFDREKDWLDVEAVARTRHGELDRDYILTWISRFLGPKDRRLQRVARLLGEQRSAAEP